MKHLIMTFAACVLTAGLGACMPADSTGDGITCALVGARNTAELQDNIDAASTPLPPPVVAELNAATAPLLTKLGKSFDYYESTENDRTQ